jgi:hypothetical protein
MQRFPRVSHSDVPLGGSFGQTDGLAQHAPWVGSVVTTVP